MGKIKVILNILGGLGLILAVGVLLILGFAGFSYGLQFIWSVIPFGLAGFVLGLVIILVTFSLPILILPERQLCFNREFFSELGFVEVIGYLYGFVIIFAAVLWFFLPAEVLRTLPDFSAVFGFSLVSTLLIYGVGGCLKIAVGAYQDQVAGSVFFGSCAGVGLWVINQPVWRYSESIPRDYYFLGKAVLAFIFLLQILYLVFFHLLPTLQEIRRERYETEATK